MGSWAPIRHGPEPTVDTRKGPSGEPTSYQHLLPRSGLQGLALHHGAVGLVQQDVERLKAWGLRGACCVSWRFFRVLWLRGEGKRWRPVIVR
jgi:hypothetical protein